MEIKNVCATYIDKNENGIFTSFGMELNLKDETEIWKQLAEKGQLPSPTLDEQGFLDGFQDFADDMDVRIYEYGAVEMDFFAEVNSHQTVVADIQEILPAETVQELHHAIHEALTEHGYEEAKLMKPLIEKNQMNEYERLAAATDKTVLEISFVNEDMSKGDTIQKLEMTAGAERYIRALGFTQLRVRMRGSAARIEVPPADIPRIAATETACLINDTLRAMGYTSVSLDLVGYGSPDTGKKAGQLHGAQ